MCVCSTNRDSSIDRVESKTMKALKCKPSAQFAYNYTINVLSKCSNIISHRSSRSTQRPSIFEGRHIDHPSSKVDTSIIDPRRSTHRSSIFESRHIDLRRSTRRSSKIEGGNIAPTFRQFVTEYCPQRRSIVIPAVRITLDEGTHAHTLIYGNSPTHALIMYYTPICIAYCASRRGN